MKFSEMPYERPDMKQAEEEITAFTKRLKAAESYEDARKAFLDEEEWMKQFSTLVQLASIRHSIDTRDPFYDEEKTFWDRTLPELQEYEQQWRLALYESRWRPEFEKEYGSLMFINTEIALKTFSPEIIPEMKRENELAQEYDNLLASAQIPFAGADRTLSQMTPFKNDSDDAVRLAAWQAEGQWYKDHQPEMDRIYHELVQVRDTMGKKLGYGGYTQLGYYRMGRNCYTKEDVERFREAVVKYVVPVADEIRRAQAERMGFSYPMSFDEEALMFRSGNPKPFGTPDEILAQGKVFYEELSPQTGEFFNVMLDNELLDVLSTEGKESGGYCTSLAAYEVPFIFANFNGTQGDVEVITHEAGHAFEAWTNRKRIPMDYIWGSMESCEVHSMSMEFFSWPWAEGFFGEDTRKFYYNHLAHALTFIPYGTMVDHFQHLVFEKPEMTPAQRHQAWKELIGTYMPWLRLDGAIPFFSEGEHWQRQHHIYDRPFYYIDYCLAQTVSLKFWAMIQEDQKAAWDCYMTYTEMGGSKVFTELLKGAGLPSPFDAACLRDVCAVAKDWLEAFNFAGIA